MRSAIVMALLLQVSGMLSCNRKTVDHRIGLIAACAQGEAYRNQLCDELHFLAEDDPIAAPERDAMKEFFLDDPFHDEYQEYTFIFTGDSNLPPTVNVHTFCNLVEVRPAAFTSKARR